MHWLEWHCNNVAYKVTTTILKTSYTKLETVFLPFPSCKCTDFTVVLCNQWRWVDNYSHPPCTLGDS